jgi:protein TonB
MFESRSTTSRRRRSILLSLACHAAAFALLLALESLPARRAIRPSPTIVIAQLEIAGGAHALPIPLPPAPDSSHTRHPVPQTEASARTILPVTQTARYSGGGAPPDPHRGDGTGHALLGNGSDPDIVTVAFPVFSPRPPVTDRSLLPAVEQKIVVDVTLDTQGNVVSVTLVHGFGNRLDQLVLDAVKTWRFQPATVNGKPVATESEVIFPFGPSYPTTIF